MKPYQVIAALATELRARLVRVEIMSDGRLYEDTTCVACIVTRRGIARLHLAWVLDGVTDRVLVREREVRVDRVVVKEEADRIEKRIAARAAQAARDAEHRAPAKEAA